MSFPQPERDPRVSFRMTLDTVLAAVRKSARPRTAPDQEVLWDALETTYRWFKAFGCDFPGLGNPCINEVIARCATEYYSEARPDEIRELAAVSLPLFMKGAEPWEGCNFGQFVDFLVDIHKALA